jgi:ADP-ribose pyrophosphatase YjhB (NUDIX family)
MSRASTRPGLGRRLVYDFYARLPIWAKRRAIELFAPKVSLGACAVIEDDAGRILLVRHTYRRQPWGLPGGLVRHGEQPADALAREVREELGVEAIIGPVLIAHNASLLHQLTIYYRATLLDSPRLDGFELNGLRYVPVDEIPDLIGRPARALLPYLPACEPPGRGIQ